MDSKSTSLNRAWLAALLALIAALLLLAAHNSFVQDDAFISFRYADNWVRGYGLVWNPGEAAPVEGYTNFLWVSLLAIGIWFKQDPVSWSFALGGLAGGGSLLLTGWLTRRLTASSGLALLSVALLGTHYSFSAYITGGLETQLQTFLLLAAACLSYALGATLDSHRPGIVIALSVLCALSFLTRMDSALICLVLLVYAGHALLIGSGTALLKARLMVALLLPGALLAGAWLLWKLSFYGDILPNTFYAKASQALSLQRGLIYSWLFYMAYGLLPFLVFCLAKVRSLWQQSFFLIIVLVCVLLWTLYVIKVSGDFMEFRFFIPVLPFIYILVVIALSRLAVWRRVLVSGLLLVLSLIHGLTFVGAYDIESIGSLRDNVMETRRNWSGAGRALHRVFGDLSEPPMIAVTAVGAIPYYSGLPTLDMLGLNDPWIARHGIVIGSRPEHTRYTTAEHLLLSGVDLVLGHPQIKPLGAPPTTDLRLFMPLQTEQLAASNRLQVIQIPINDLLRLDVLWISDHPGLQALILEGSLVIHDAVLP